MTVPSEAAQFNAAQDAEYGVYRAVAPIFVDGVRAFNPGHPVPVSHVEAYGYLKDGLVERIDDPDSAVVEVPEQTPPQGADISLTEEN